MYICVCIIGELINEEKQYSGIRHSIEGLQKDMIRLNTLITSKRGEHNALEHNNQLLEKDFVSALKVYILYIALVSITLVYVLCIALGSRVRVPSVTGQVKWCS